MWRVPVLIVVTLGTAACATGARWERPGGTEAERRRDETECAAQANRERSVPAQRITTRSGGRTTESMELVTVRDLDPGVFDECMRTRGYDRVPARPPASLSREAVGLAARRRSGARAGPSLRTASCYVVP